VNVNVSSYHITLNVSQAPVQKLRGAAAIKQTSNAKFSIVLQMFLETVSGIGS